MRWIDVIKLSAAFCEPEEGRESPSEPCAMTALLIISSLYSFEYLPDCCSTTADGGIFISCYREKLKLEVEIDYDCELTIKSTFDGGKPQYYSCDVGKVDFYLENLYYAGL